MAFFDSMIQAVGPLPTIRNIHLTRVTCLGTNHLSFTQVDFIGALQSPLKLAGENLAISA
jgi:hypothetical protein